MRPLRRFHAVWHCFWTARAAFQIEMSRRAPVVLSHRQWGWCRSCSSLCRWGSEGSGSNLRRCHNPSITWQQKQPCGVTVHLFCLFPVLSSSLIQPWSTGTQGSTVTNTLIIKPIKLLYGSEWEQNYIWCKSTDCIDYMSAVNKWHYCWDWACVSKSTQPISETPLCT